MKSIDDDKIRAIGIYGMGGVGKTTVLNKVANKARESNKFDGVVSVFVSQTPDMARIRAKIQYRLGLLGSTESSKTILILMDDLWKRINLKDIEIPEDDDKLKVRLVMTSRNQHLLLNEMSCHKTFSIGVLDEEEGRQFFAELVGIKVEELQKNPTTIDQLLKRCAGLPVSIEALATLWKKKTTHLSAGDLNMDELIQESNRPRDGSVSIEWSYNYLGDSYEEKQAKMLFRTIGLLGTPNVPVLTLLKYSVGLGLFGNVTDINIMERARREVTRSLRMLQDSSLLLESDDINHVKIHDVVRDVAVAITSRDDHALISNPLDDVKGWSRAKMKKSTAVSLTYSELHKGWKCPNAEIFIMKVGDEQGEPVELSDSFFQGMVKMKVLHLEKARLTSLPSSIIQSDMCNVTTLCLHYCYLGDVSMIGKLVSLQVLSFVGSELANLPEEIGDLSKLRMLDLSNCSELKAIAPGVLQRLKQLEELYLKESFQEWEVEGVAQQSNSSLAELNHLPHLNTIEVCVPDPSKLPSDLPLNKLVRYKVVMGDEWEKSRDYKESRYLKLKMESGDIFAEEWLQSALQKTQDLHLDGGSSGTTRSFHELCREGFEELKHLHLQNSSSIKYIIWSTEWLSSSAFTVLESMILENMESLEKICHGSIDSACFSKLKVIKVYECHKLRNLFNLSLVKGLMEVEEIEITDCKMIHEIVWVERQENDGDDEDALICCTDNLLGCTGAATNANTGVSLADYEIMLGRLRCLTLRSLPEMSTFFSNEASSSTGTIPAAPTFFNDHQVSSHNYCKPKKLFSAPKYKDIQASLRLEFFGLRQLELVDCNKIVHFMSFKMLLKFVNLESLSIERCELLEDIFDLQGIDAESGNNTVEILPNLYELKLRGLPKLEHIWKKHSRRIKGCAKLRTLEVYECRRMRYLFSSSMCQGMENLTEVNIGHCGEMATVILEEEGLANDASSTVTQLISLKILAISHCYHLKEFLSKLNIEESTAFKCSIKGMCWGKQANPANTNSIFFSDKVLLPSLVTLILSLLYGFQKLWCDEVLDRSYCNLEFIHLEGFGLLQTVFPATLIERLQNLRQLRLKSCRQLETVIDVDVVWKTKRKPTSLMLPQLQEVSLDSLGKLRHIMDDSEIVIGFPSLTRLEVSRCDELIYLIRTTTATTLLKLERLEISDCAKLQEVIHGEVSEGNKKDDISFPHLTSLIMSGLESLTCFSSDDYLFHFTRLKVLHILGCKLLETLVKQTSSDEDQANNTAPQALFNDKVNLPNLEELWISRSDQVEEVWCSERQSRSGGDSLCKLKFLRITQCSRLRNVVPSFMIQRLQNMEGTDICVISVLPKLTSLELEELPKLRNLSPSDSSYTLELASLEKLIINNTGGAAAAALGKVHLPNIDELKVCNEDITKLWHSEPNGGSFCKLKDFEVKQCGQLVKIIPLFMLKRLQNLEKLVVKRCHQLETVCDLGEESERSIDPFQNLNWVQVENCKLLRNLFKISTNGEASNSDKLIALPRLTNLRLQHLPNFSHLLFQQGELQYTFEMSALKDFILMIGSRDEKAVTQKVLFPKELKIRAHDQFTFFGSINTVLKEILSVLSDQTNQNNQIIGLLGKLSRDLSWPVRGHRNSRVVLCENFRAEEIQKGLEDALGIVYSGGRKEERAQRLHTTLLSYRERRTLILLLDNVGEAIMDLEVEVGIPHPDKLNPRFFKMVLISENVDVLNKMGAQQLINIGNMEHMWKIFPKEFKDSKMVFGEQELPAVDDHRTTNMKYDTSTFFNRSPTPAMNDIMKALHSHQNNPMIIGLFGSRENLKMDLGHLLQQEAKPFELLYLNLGEDNNVEIEIQNELGRILGITYDDDDRTGKRAQCLRESLLNNQDKRVLLVLDGLDRAIDLEEAVGIPHEGQHNPGLFKILIVSKGREVFDKMGAQRVIDIHNFQVSEEEWFGYRILDGYLGTSDFKRLAEHCGYSDVMAELLVDKLKGQGWRAWANAYKRLKDSPFEYNARMRVIYSLPADLQVDSKDFVELNESQAGPSGVKSIN